MAKTGKISIPNVVLSNKKITRTATLLFGLLKFHQYDKPELTISRAELAADLGGVSLATISKAIKGLEAEGYIKVYREYKKQNIYQVRKIISTTWIQVPMALLSSAGTATEKLTVGYVNELSKRQGVCYAWQSSMAQMVGCSRTTAHRTLSGLETAGRMKVQHRGGGRKRGNYYVLINSIVLKHEAKKTVSKLYAKDKKYLKDFKEPPIKVFSSGDLSSADEAYNRLRRHGVNRKVAESLVFEQQTPAESVNRAIDNALVREAHEKHRLGQLFCKKTWNLAGYIVGTLNTARREVKIVRPSKLYLREKAGLNKRGWAPMAETEFQRRRDQQVAALLAG